MSGSLTSISDNVSYALNLHSRAITRLQEQASTGNRINRGSDGPTEACRILGLNSQVRSLASYQDNITELMGALEISSTVVTDMVSEIASIRPLLTQIVGGIHDSDGQKRIGEKLNNALEQLVALANTRHAGQYLFGGQDTGTAPYRVERDGARIAAVTYQGGEEARSVPVASGLTIEGYHVGDAIFRSDDRGAPVFAGRTGAAAGTGTSSVRGDVWLTVEHDGTNYRVSIDDGASFVTVLAGGQTNQAVTDSRTGRVLYVDTTAIHTTGVELVRVPGTYDLFGMLISLRDLLLNERGLSHEEIVEYATVCAGAVEEVRNLLVQTEVSTGSNIGFLDTLKQNLENMEFNTQDETTRLQEADIAQIAIDLSRREVLYQMSLSVAGKLMSLSLLDFIR